MIVRCILVSVAVLGIAGGSVRGEESGAPESGGRGEPAICKLEFRISPLMDLMMYVRALAERGAEADVPDIAGFDEALAAVERIAGDVRGRWGVFSGPAHSCETAVDMAELGRGFPESITLRSGQEMEIRRITLAMADALSMVEEDFRRELWPGRRAKLEKAAEALRSVLKPKEADIYAFTQEKIGAEDPQEILPVYLLVEAPWPGAMTYRSRAGNMAFVGVDAAAGSQLLEIVIHETLHAIDGSTARAGNVFTELRKALAAAGVDRNDPRMHDVPHMVMFIHAAETVRRLIDPEHIDYGETEARGERPLYERDAKSVDAVREPWRAYLDGKIDRAEAVRRIARAAIAGEARPPGAVDG